jgi:hypothetical protein
MANHPHLAGTVPAGRIVKPWLMLGPYYEDLSARVQGLTYFERPSAQVGQAAVQEVLEDARPVLASRPCEGQEQRFRGKTARWSLVRSPEQYLSWGTYNISNHLGAAFLSTWLAPAAPGRTTWRLVHRNPLLSVVYVNGAEIFRSDGQPADTSAGVFEYTFEEALQPGENLVMVGLFRIARMAQVGFRLEIEGADVEARVAPFAEVSAQARAAVEEEVSSVRLARDIFYPEHPVGFRLEQAPACRTPESGVRLQVELLSEDGEALRSVPVNQAGAVTLCQGSELADGHYTILASWRGPGGEPITQARYAVHKLTPAAPIPGYERTGERKQVVLAHYADNRERDIHAIWTQVARYALGQPARVDEGVIRKTCEFINARKDCADFVIQGILRLMFWEREERRLSPEINALMKDAVLNFKYWVDEPGDTVMYMGSENHRLLFHVAEWLAGHLYPTETFTNSQQNGLYHTAKAYVYITEWLRQRGRFGFDEWHSNSYYPICVAPLLNLHDFATHEGYYKLRQMTAAVLDLMLFNQAADGFQGIFGTTHGRSYGIYVKYPDFEGTAALNWLYFGVGSLSKTTSGMAPVLAATSSYQVPRVLYGMANDREAVFEARRRQGILRTSARHADFVVFRTPDYMLSGLQDHRKGEFESSTHVAQVTLGNKNVIFWSCPHTVGEGSGLRPDYWSGNSTMPRVIQYRNVMSLTWRLTRFTWMSHCFFEQERFDEARLRGNWAFARVGDGYVGIYSQHGYTVGSDGQYAGRELQCGAPENTWLVECGRKADWGSFDAFVTALENARIEADGGAVVYESPSAGRFVTGWDAAPEIDGEKIRLSGYAMVDSPWARAAFGSGELALRYGGEEYELWFNQ